MDFADFDEVIRKVKFWIAIYVVLSTAAVVANLFIVGSAHLFSWVIVCGLIALEGFDMYKYVQNQIVKLRLSLTRTTKHKLVDILKLIVEKNTKYDERYPLVVEAMGLATRLEYKVGVRYDKDEKNPEKWPVFCIQIPTGEVSWHMPAWEQEFTRYDDKEKFKRIDDYAKM
jgi:hypothetical protein